MRRSTWLPWLSLVALAAAAPAQTLAPGVQRYVKVSAPVVALTHVRVIDGTGAPARDEQTVILRQGKIAALGDAATVIVPKDALVLDLHGDSVMPGLVGMHDHLFYPAGGGIYSEMAFSFPRLYLAAGVTTIRTTGSLEPYADINLAQTIAKGEAPGPRMHVTGPYLEGPSAWALQMTRLSTPAEATAAVDFWVDRGVDNFKAYNYLSRAVLGAAIAEAHKRGVKVTGHLCSIGFHEAIDLGIDCLEHGLVVDTELFADKKPDECPADGGRAARVALAKMSANDPQIQALIRDLVAHHVAVTSTLPVFEIFVPGKAPLQQRVLDSLSAEARAAYLANRVNFDAPQPDPKTGQVVPSSWPALFALEERFERDFVQAGGLLLAGLDPTGAGGVVAGFGDQREVELLVEAGFSPLEAIHIATANGAQYLGELDRIGTLAAGKQADLVVVKGDPSRQIADIENVEIVFQNGVGFDPGKLVEAARGLVGIR